MLKVSLFSGDIGDGQSSVVPLFTAADTVFEKVASAHLLPEVVRYIDTLRPRQDAQYVLVNALGAGEYFGSNVNGDYFPEAALIHKPDDWTGNPLLDKIRAKEWAYGFPTFYYAHPYAHHRNKDATRAFGEVELSVWNDQMKRVELICRVDKGKCEQFGGVPVWDKLKAGQHPDVSMGCKVPYDTCAICLDWKLYREAQSTFDPKKHKSPGEAVLAFHKKKQKIRGLSITRADYCDHAKKSMNKILPDGRKVFVYNDYPRFFDISFVFIGADKTAKVMMKVAHQGRVFSFGSAELAEKLGYVEGEEKTASAVDGLEDIASHEDEPLKLAFLGKAAKSKRSEIVKDVVPSQFTGKAIPVLTATEKDLPDDLLDTMAKVPLETSLSTSGSMGIVLRPREFQRIVLIRMGQRDFADDLDLCGSTFPKTEEKAPMSLGLSSVLGPLVRLLLPFLAERSAMAPAVERRVISVSLSPSSKEKRGSSSLSSPLLRKISAAYNSYREQLMDLAQHTPAVLRQTAPSSEFSKVASARPEEVFSPLSVAYLETAFLDEVGPRHESGHNKLATTAGVERGFPSRNT